MRNTFKKFYRSMSKVDSDRNAKKNLVQPLRLKYRERDRKENS